MCYVCVYICMFESSICKLLSCRVSKKQTWTKRCVKEVWGVHPGSTSVKCKRSGMESREKLNCNVVVTQTSAPHTGSIRVGMVLQSSPWVNKVREPTLFHDLPPNPLYALGQSLEAACFQEESIMWVKADLFS